MSKLKIIVPLAISAIVVIVCIISLFFMPKKTINISAGADITLSLSYGNKVIKAEALNEEGKNVLDAIGKLDKNVNTAIKSILETSYNLTLLNDDTDVNILFSSSDLEKDKSLISDISTELELCVEEIPLNSNINEYKVTKKDYKTIKKIKKNTSYDEFEILNDGFVSSEKNPYITSILYKDDSFFINFSKEVIFNGSEDVVCYNGNNYYNVVRAGYNKNTFAVIVENFPVNTSLNFDVSIKDYANLYAPSIAVDKKVAEDNPRGISFILDADGNQKKLEELKGRILLLDDESQSEILNQYKILESYVQKITTSEDLKDFNKMIGKLEASITEAESLDTLDKEDTSKVSPSPSPSPSTTPKPTSTTTPTPTPTPVPTTEDLNALNQKYYNELNGYKAVVLGIQNAEERNTLNKEINLLYYELSVSKTSEDYRAFEGMLNTFLNNLAPYR